MMKPYRNAIGLFSWSKSKSKAIRAFEGPDYAINLRINSPNRNKITTSNPFYDNPYFMPILEGLLAGIGTIIFVGPVFTLLQISLEQGKSSGLSVALGIIASDILIVALFYFGAIELFQKPHTQIWLAILGSIVLIILGAKYIIKPYTPLALESTQSYRKLPSSFAKGFLVNFVNPFVFFVWIALLTYAESKFDSRFEVNSYIISVLAGIFITDVSKVLLADRLQSQLKPVLLRKLFITIGSVLILFSFRLIYFAFNEI